MKRGLVIGVIAVVVFLVVIFIGLRPDPPLDNSIADNLGATLIEDNSNAPTENNSDSSLAKTYAIGISGFTFSPETLVIKVGDTVTWTNQDSAKHTVTSDSGSELNSELLRKGEGYSHTFTQAGIYEYHCEPHPYMTGKVVVE